MCQCLLHVVKRISGWNLCRNNWRGGVTVRWKFHNRKFNRFWLIHLYHKQTTERWMGNSIQHAPLNIYAICCRVLKILKIKVQKLDSFETWVHALAYRSQLGSFGCETWFRLTNKHYFHVQCHPFVFSMRQQIAYMLSALYAIACPSVYMSVCHMGGSHKNG